MKSFFWLILLAIVATITALGVYSNGGYVLLVLPPWRVELSLNLLPILLILGFAVFYMVLRAYALIRQLPSQARAYQAHRQQLLAHECLFQANRLLFEGRVGQALKKASEAYLAGAPKGLSALIAARAAQRMRNTDLVEPWVERAIQDDPETKAAALMLQAETEIDQHRFTEALQTLKKLQDNSGRHFAAQKLELRARQGVGDWADVLRLARLLQKREAISASYAQAIKQKAHMETIRLWKTDAKSLLAYLRKIPEMEKTPPIVQLAAVKLQGLEADVEAQKLLESLLDERQGSPWESKLVMLYGKLTGGDVTRRISRAEGWLLKSPRDASLLLCLGLLCMQQRLWGKAQSYLEASISVEPSFDAHMKLAQLLEQLERENEANRHYRAAALLGPDH